MSFQKKKKNDEMNADYKQRAAYLKLSINEPLEYTARDSTIYSPKKMKCIDSQYQKQDKTSSFHAQKKWHSPPPRMEESRGLP